MTKQENIEELNSLLRLGPLTGLSPQTLEAIKEATIAYEEQKPKTGRWVEENVNGGGRRVFCSECGCPPPFEHINTGDVYSASGYGVINKTKFCPSCGARMESKG